MKKILLYILLLGISSTGCKDYLEEENLSNSVDSETYYATADGYSALILAAYSSLRDVYGSDEPVLFCAGTDMYTDGRNPIPAGLNLYASLGPTSEGVEILYENCYKSIQICNMGIAYNGKTEEVDELGQYLGEVEYIRALNYFLLVQTYGGIPLVTEMLESPVLSFDRVSESKVYDLIISDLEDALGKVSTADYSGRVTKRAVQHLLSKVYLTRGYESYGESTDFSTAADYAVAAINGQGLNLTFEELWTPGNDINEEVLFSVLYSEETISTDNTGIGNPQGGYFGSYMGGSEFAGDNPWRSYTYCPSKYLLELFEEGDTRWDATFMTTIYDRYYDYYDVEDKSTLDVAYFYAAQWQTTDEFETVYMAENPGAVFRQFDDLYIETSDEGGDLVNFDLISVKKFDDPTAEFGEFVGTRDIILSRLGETYLLAAEAYYKAGNTPSALTYMNEVRRRAGVANLTDITSIDDILDERARELVGEYHRWFDLKRTQTLVERVVKYVEEITLDDMMGKNDTYKILRPIPQDALDLNRSDSFYQNPAYE